MPSQNMIRSTFKGGSKSWVWVSEVKRIKIVVGHLAWQQIKAVDSLNHLELFTNHNCLTKRFYLLKGSILGSERSNGSQKYIIIGDVEGPMGAPTRRSETNFFHRSLCSFTWIYMLPEANHNWHSQNIHFQNGCHEKMKNRNLHKF